MSVENGIRLPKCCETTVDGEKAADSLRFTMGEERERCGTGGPRSASRRYRRGVDIRND
ncbi:MAG: hypothetical protein ACU84J_07290 [Gammaproteobacteria bacterium]